jgi:DNA-binding LacI/PurR family transcriptional regulator
VTAILTVNDEVGMAVLRACRRRDVAVPEQVSVVGLDDSPAAAEAGPTTVHQSFVEKGRVAAQLHTDGASVEPHCIVLPADDDRQTRDAKCGRSQSADGVVVRTRTESSPVSV